MQNTKKIKTALISVWDKNNLNPIIKLLAEQDIKIISTGNTANYIENQGYQVTRVEDITEYPAILGGRVKTLHPKIFGAILQRQENPNDQEEIKKFDIPTLDLVVVDLYPFQETLKTDATHQEIIEKIDIGGISLIRAAAKNYNDVLVISQKSQYSQLEEILKNNPQANTLEQRQIMAGKAFAISSEYDNAISNYLISNDKAQTKELRYGENPHQKAQYNGNLNEIFTQIHGKEISYNNLLDIDAAINLMAEFQEPSCAIIKHTNPCGLASAQDATQAWHKALAGDPISAFGSIIIFNRQITEETAKEINKIFFEIIIAPDYTDKALEILKVKKNRRILILKKYPDTTKISRTILNGTLTQDKDTATETPETLITKTTTAPSPQQIEELLFANKIVKHCKSNAIVLTKNKQLCAGGVGQTSRIDALKQAIEKAQKFNFNLEDAVMASDAFFPFADAVETAHKAGIKAVIQPGGSIKDQDSIDYCNQNDISMVFTGIRHFKH